MLLRVASSAIGVGAGHLHDFPGEGTKRNGTAIPTPKKNVDRSAPSSSQIASRTRREEPTIGREYFTTGSTKDEVLAVQGTPDKFTENVFHYGASEVHFQNGRVVRWENYGQKLKVRMRPEQE